MKLTQEQAEMMKRFIDQQVGKEISLITIQRPMIDSVSGSECGDAGLTLEVKGEWVNSDEVVKPGRYMSDGLSQAITRKIYGDTIGKIAGCTEDDNGVTFKIQPNENWPK